MLTKLSEDDANKYEPAIAFISLLGWSPFSSNRLDLEASEPFIGHEIDSPYRHNRSMSGTSATTLNRQVPSSPKKNGSMSCKF
jgi:hypothetical protein